MASAGWSAASPACRELSLYLGELAHNLIDARHRMRVELGQEGRRQESQELAEVLARVDLDEHGHRALVGVGSDPP